MVCNTFVTRILLYVLCVLGTGVPRVEGSPSDISHHSRHLFTYPSPLPLPEEKRKEVCGSFSVLGPTRPLVPSETRVSGRLYPLTGPVGDN